MAWLFMSWMSQNLTQIECSFHLHIGQGVCFRRDPKFPVGFLFRLVRAEVVIATSDRQWRLSFATGAKLARRPMGQTRHGHGCGSKHLGNVI